MSHGLTTYLPSPTRSGPVAAFQDELSRALHPLLCNLPDQITVLLDQPRGQALRVLNTAPGAAGSLIIVTDSASPEYLEDLWDHAPGLLATGVKSVPDLTRLVQQAMTSGPLRWTPGLSTRLTAAERRLLRALSQGHSNKVIARDLALSERTVHNTFTRIFNKLGVDSRLEAALLYWDVGPFPR